VDTTGENIGSEKPPELYRYNVDMQGSPDFMNLACEPEVFYERSGYRELYDHLASQWSIKKKFRVILQGKNAGTGKSWFQVYASKRLLDDDEERKFDNYLRH
jgi:hypothetical protein